MHTPYQHWTYTQDADQIGWAYLNRQDGAVNSINTAILEELDDLLKSCEAQLPRALVIGSAKKSGFIAGADIMQFKGVSSATEATTLIQKGQKVFDRLAALPVPTIAMIEGFCLGGGLELALACRYRIADDGEKTRLGLPEVKLGIHPGWGGTVRLPSLIGAGPALDLILTGRTLRATDAKRLGMVDAAVPKRLLKAAVLQFAISPPARAKLRGWHAWSDMPFIRMPLAWMIERKLRTKVTPNQYPAPFQALENWRAHGVQGRLPYAIEAESIGRLVVSSTARSLVNVFFLQERLKSFGKGKQSTAHVHVIGAGVMGGAIAAWCALRGCTVTLQDQAPALIGKSIKAAYDLGKKQLKAQHLLQQMMDRLTPDVEGRGIAKADVIIEAVSEKFEIKQIVFQQIEAHARPDAIIATNTSTFPIEQLATALQDPSRLVGIHFFNPVAKMPLVEVVQGVDTQAGVIEKALAFVQMIGKLPLPVKSAPGFLVNRILLPYMLEAVSLLEEGVSGPTIDQAAVEWGLPMGPIALADTVGLDICLAALESLSSHLGGYNIPPALREKVAKGHLGCKTGEGFYRYKKGVRIDTERPVLPIAPDIVDRMVFRILNEAMACLREGVVTDPELLDAGAIFGFGFPPFRGGVMPYIRQAGVMQMCDKLRHLEARYGARFRADAGWAMYQKQLNHAQ